MAADSKIEWTHHTFNPWRGCTHAVLPNGSEHPGCSNCYAEAMSKRNPAALGRWGLPMADGGEGVRVMGSADYWRQPLKWNRAAAKAGERHRVFCASLADVFEDWQGPIHDSKGETVGAHSDGCICDPDKARPARDATMSDLRRYLFSLIDATPHLDWLLLTKRPENVRRMWLNPVGNGEYAHCEPEFGRKNVWLGTSISDQPTADLFVPRLLECRELCPVLFISAEPLVGPVNLGSKNTGGADALPIYRQAKTVTHRCGFSGQTIGVSTDCPPWARHDGNMQPWIDWVIVGGESGNAARPMALEWARSLKDQCEAAGVACFVKQFGGYPIVSAGDENDHGWGREMIPLSITADATSSHPDLPVAYAVKLKDKKGGDMAEWPADLRVRQFPEVPHA